MLEEITRTGVKEPSEALFDWNISRFDDVEHKLGRRLNRVISQEFLEMFFAFTGDYGFPTTEIVNATGAFEVLAKPILTDVELIESNIIVRMPPKEKYTVTLAIKSIRKADPKIVEPDWL